MKRHWIIFKNGVKFYIMADSFAISGDSLRYEFTRTTGVTGAFPTGVQPDVVLKSEVASILVDGTIDNTGNGTPLVG